MPERDKLSRKDIIKSANTLPRSLVGRRCSRNRCYAQDGQLQ